jgi:hypothetical protein
MHNDLGISNAFKINITLCITIDVQTSDKFNVVSLAKSRGFFFVVVEALLRVTIRENISGDYSIGGDCNFLYFDPWNVVCGSNGRVLICPYQL